MGTRKEKVMPSRKQAGSGQEVGSSAWQKQAWGRQEDWLQSMCGNAHNTRESMLTPCQRLKAKGIGRMKRSVHTQKSGQASQCDICKRLHPAGPPCALWPCLSCQSFPTLGSPDPPLLTCLGHSASIQKSSFQKGFPGEMVLSPAYYSTLCETCPRKTWANVSSF